MKIFTKLLVYLLLTMLFYLTGFPFAYVDWRLGVLFIAIAIFVFTIVRHRHTGQWRHTQAQTAAILAIILTFFSQPLLKFFEAGFDDGPFIGESYDGELNSLKVDHTIAYGDGQLRVYNRSDEEAPIIACFDAKGNVEWAWLMDVRLKPGYETAMLYAIDDPEIESGLLRDRIVFLSTWTYGAEHAYAYVWKWGGPQRFYLSW